MKGDSRWVTALHYAFQDDEYLVRRLSKVGGCCLGTKEMLGSRRERDPSYGNHEASTPHHLLGLEPPPELWLEIWRP